MSEKIVQIIPAPEGLNILFEGPHEIWNGGHLVARTPREIYAEPVASLGLTEEGLVIALKMNPEGYAEPAMDAPYFRKIVWGDGW